MPGTFGSGIKSIQRGEVTNDANPDTVTISAVVLAKSILHFNESGTDTAVFYSSNAVLTNTTTITFTQKQAKTGNLYAWQVIEYY